MHKLLGKTAGELTQFEKRQAFLNAVTEQGTRKFQEFADSVDPNVYSRLAASFADIAQSVLSFVNKALGPMIGFLVDNRILIVGLFLSSSNRYRKTSRTCSRSIYLQDIAASVLQQVLK